MSEFGYPLYPVAPTNQQSLGSITGTTTLGAGAATYSKHFFITGAGGYTITLPALDAVNFPTGTFSIFNNSSALCTVNAAGSDTMLLLGSSYSSVSILPGERFYVQNMVSNWIIGLESPQRTTTAPIGDNSIRTASTAFVNPLAAVGQCRLSVVSTTSLKLAPYGGQCLNINGTVQQIPSAGVTVSNASLSASTLYYVYAYMNGGVMTLELSATGHSTNTNGVEIKTGDATRSLVGMIYTNSSSQFVDAITQRFCLNWFNRRALQGQAIGSGTYTNTGSNAEITTTGRVSFLTWADEAVSAFSAGNLTTNTANASTSFSLFMDGSPFGPQQSVNPASANIGGPYNSGATSFLTETVHTSGVYGFVSSGTGTATFNNNVLIRG